MELVTAPDGEPFTVKFTPGLPMGAGPWIFLDKKGSIHAGEILWIENALSPTGRSQVLRTTNPAGGKHSIFDIPVSKLLGYAFAGDQGPFVTELSSAY
jgi:hypothetical protein